MSCGQREPAGQVVSSSEIMDGQKDKTATFVPTVLIVDDDIQMRFYLMTLVKSLGFTPVLAKDGNEGLAELKRSSPDIIILDIMMPNMGGTIFYQQFLRLPEYCSIPVIFFSGVDRKAFFHYIKMLNLKNENPIPEPEYYVAKDADPQYFKQLIKICAQKKGV